MSFTEKNMYELLPAIYRIRDEEQGGPLKALIEIIAAETKLAENNIAELYENWFIETCREWVVPYIGDMLGVRSLHAIPGSAAVSQRAYVANTLALRKRKGEPGVLEQLALDVAGWRAHVVEFFELLSTTQYMNHIRLHRPVAPDLRKMNQLDLLDTPFDSIAHTADMRHISTGRGKHNIPNIGLFIWRLQSYPVSISDAVKINCPPNPPRPQVHFFTFDPTGINIHLFNKPQTETSITHLSTELNVPGLLRRRALFDELEARRQALVDGLTPVYNYFDDREAIEGVPASKKHPVFEIYPDGDPVPVPPEEILIFNLKNCCIAPATRKYKKKMPDGSFTDVNMPITVVVDPEWGRFAFTDPSVIKALVSYSYGFSGDTGSGTYSRQSSIPEKFLTETTWHAGVRTMVDPLETAEIYTSVRQAIDKWNQKPAGTTGVITVMDSRSYTGDLPIVIKEKSRLLLVAADWPLTDIPGTLPPEKSRKYGDIAAGDLRPHINGDITITGKVPEIGTANFDTTTGGEIFISGFLVEGKVSVLEGNLDTLTIMNSTLIPGNGGLEVGAGSPDVLSNQWLKINLQHTICGAVNLFKTPAISLLAEDCILDHATGFAVDAEKTPLIIKNTTLLGKTLGKTIEAENCIFNDTVKAIRRQTGCIRFSYVPLLDTLAPLPLISADTPKRFRCQPELEITSQITEAEKNGPMPDGLKRKLRNEIMAWLKPVFTNTIFGHHAYAQLSYTCPEQVYAGADDGSEMGAFKFLAQPQRAANLRIALDEYLPLGLEAGIFYTT